MIAFLSPLLLWGTLLGSIPIIIHLLNRRRFRRVDWAPMHYLKLTIQRNRRRIQIEQLLLLLLRVALLMLLFFFLARPVLSPTGLEQWLGKGGRTSQVVLIDDSLSMGYTSPEGSSFGRARDSAAAILASVRPQDRCTVLTSSMPRTPVLHEVEGSRRDDLTGTVLALPLSATHAAWPAVFQGLEDVLQSCTYPRPQVTILTDLRRSGWDKSVRSTTERWKEAGVRLRIVDVGEDDTANVSIQGLLPLDRTVLSGATSRWEVIVKNESTRVLSGAKAVVRVDDKPTEMSLPEIASQETVRVPVPVTFPSAGPHDLSVQIPDDELPGDNRYWAAVPVKESLLIRLVDGEPSAEPFGSEVDYLAAPLSVGIGAAEAWRVEVAQDHDFLAPRREIPDVLVLANVAAPTSEQAEKINQLVSEGMGLLIFTGAKLDVGLYNDLFFPKDNRLLPCMLKSLTDETIHGLIVEVLRPSPLEKLLELKPSALERVPVRQFMTVDEPNEPGPVRVLARWNNPARSPAVIERIKGQGRVLLWTTTADRAGNDWPVEPSFVLAVREAVRGTARPTRLDNTVTAGERMRRIVHTSQQVSNVKLNPPGGGEPEALASAPFDSSPSDPGPAFEINIPDTRRPGLYRLAWDEGTLGTQQDIYASNPDPRESALERIEGNELKSMLAPLPIEIARARGKESGLFSATGREIWHDLAGWLLVLLVVESIFATWVGRSR